MKVFLDADGVLLDFVSAACRLHGRDPADVACWDFYKKWGMTDKEFWDPIKDRGETFYCVDVDPYPWAEDLIEAVRSVDKNFCVVTATGGGHAEDYSGKVKALQARFGEMPMMLVPPGTKHLLSGPDRFLIDDCDQNIDDFRKLGGLAVTFPQPWNRLRLISSENNKLEYVRSALDRFLLSRGR